METWELIGQGETYAFKNDKTPIEAEWEIPMQVPHLRSLPKVPMVSGDDLSRLVSKVLRKVVRVRDSGKWGRTAKLNPRD